MSTHGFSERELDELERTRQPYTRRRNLFRVVSDAGVMGTFNSANEAAAYLDNATLDGVRLRESGRCWAESWGVAPYYDGPWVKITPQPRYNAWKKEAKS